MSGERYPPLDIQIEILKRLPIKSLLKFTSVSKQWKSIIQSSRFVTDYNGSHIQPHQMLFLGNDSCYDYEHHHVDIYNDDYDDISFLQRLTLPMSAEFSKLIGYSHGLFGFHCYNNINDSVVVIWNPSIRKSVFIPVPQHSIDETEFFFTVCNATDPTIIKITMSWQKVEIYKLSSGDWRTLSYTPPRESFSITPNVVIDRFVYWIAIDMTPEGDCLDDLILSFDITHEQFSELCLPPTLKTRPSNDFDLGLSKFGESLVVLQYHPNNIDVWIVMEAQPQNPFTKLYTVKPPYTKPGPLVIGFRKNGEPIIGMGSSTNNGWTILFYEPDLERFNDVQISGHEATAGSYMETLLLLDH